jgi:type IV fimbrial biogenesis protein FimT
MLHTSSLSHPRRQSGFTIVEVLVVVTILGLLAALALPSFQPLIERWRVKTTIEELQSSLYFARSKAIGLGGKIAIVKNDVSGSCVSTGNDDWKCGWRIFVDADNNGTQAACTPADPTECTIQESNPSPNMLVVVAPTDGGGLFMDRNGRFTDKKGLVPVNTLSMDVIAKDRTLTDLSTRRLCIFGAGRFKQIKGSESC